MNELKELAIEAGKLVCKETAGTLIRATKRVFGYPLTAADYNRLVAYKNGQSHGYACVFYKEAKRSGLDSWVIDGCTFSTKEALEVLADYNDVLDHAESSGHISRLFEYK